MLPLLPVSLLWQLLLLGIGIDGLGPFCETPGCKQVVRMLEENIDTEVNPCHDFYAYACNGYKSVTNRANDSSMLNQMHQRIYRQLGEMLDRIAINRHPNPNPRNQNTLRIPQNVVGVVSGVYRKCKEIREQLLQERPENTWAYVPRDVIRRLHGMPMFTRAVRSCTPSTFATDLAETHLQNMLYYNDEGYAAPAFFTPLVETYSLYKMTVVMKVIAEIESTYKGLTPEQTFERVRSILKSYAHAIGRAPWLPNGREDLAIVEIVRLEYTLHAQDINIQNKTELSYAEFKTLLNDSIDLDKYTDVLFPAQALEALRFRRDNNTENDPKMIRLFEFEYFVHLNAVLKETACNVQYNYIFYKLIEMSYLARDQISNFSCVEVLMKSPLKIAVTALYLQSHYPNQYMWSEVRPMAVSIRQEMQTLIANAHWMTPAPKYTGKEKAEKMDMLTAASTIFYSIEKLEQFHIGLRFDNGLTYYANRRAIGEWYMKLMMNRVDLSQSLCVNDVWYIENALEINAFYTRDYNRIVIQPGIMMEPCYQNDYPMVYKYAVLGHTIGHEITHGFDNRGRLHDKEGLKVDWSDEETDDNYNFRAGCFLGQYSRQRVEDITSSEVYINGEKTFQENIADNGGIKAAFWAYKTWQREMINKGEKELLPKFQQQSLKYRTTDQLFFISAAQGYCNTYTEETLQLLVEIDNHSPNKYRVNIPLQNFAEFSMAFRCAANSSMNPQNKCSVW